MHLRTRFPQVNVTFAHTRFSQVNGMFAQGLCHKFDLRVILFKV